MAAWLQSEGHSKTFFEVSLNVSLLLASLFLAAGVFHSRLPSEQASGRVSGPQRGTKLEIPGVNWSGSRQTLVLALSTHCRFCAGSAGFYRQAGHLAKANVVRIVAVLPEPTNEASLYLERLEVPVSLVTQVPLGRLHVSATPTLMIVNSEGEITDSWIGQLTPNLEKEVMSKLRAFRE
jgi:hypothetical protein